LAKRQEEEQREEAAERWRPTMVKTNAVKNPSKEKRSAIQGWKAV
jgi:hypothetical protein